MSRARRSERMPPQCRSARRLPSRRPRRLEPRIAQLGDFAAVGADLVSFHGGCRSGRGRRWCSRGSRCFRRQHDGARRRRIASRAGRASRRRSRRCRRRRCLCHRRPGPANAEPDGHGSQDERGHHREMPWCRGRPSARAQPGRDGLVRGWTIWSGASDRAAWRPRTIHRVRPACRARSRAGLATAGVRSLPHPARGLPSWISGRSMMRSREA